MCIEKTPWEQVIDFHGHTCPEIALGYRIAQIAKRELGSQPGPAPAMLVTAHTHSCALDAFQIINRATFGRGNLLVDEKKQHVYTFQSKNMLETLQISVNSEMLEYLVTSDEGLSTREKQNKSLEAIRSILGAEESFFCSIQKASKS